MIYEIETTDSFNKWLLKLRDKQAIRAIGMRMLRAEEGDLGDVASVGGPVSEMRIFVGKGYRVYFTVREGRLILLLNGGDKSSQARDIRRAKDMLDELE